MNDVDRISRRTFGAGILAAGMFGRSAESVAQQNPQRGGTLVATWGGGEPQACYVPSGGGISPTFSSSKLLERLARKKLNGDVVGVLAESWKPSDDFMSYTIKIRRGVKWHDGRDFTVDDVAYSIGEIWKKYSAPLYLNELISVEAIDADTIIVKYSKPTPESFFASTLLGSVNYILPRHIYVGIDPVTNPANNAPIGTGPWKFGAWIRGSHFEFERNEHYWQTGLPYLDRVVIRYLRDPAARAAAIEAGDIQLGVFNPVAPPDIKRLTAAGKFDATTAGYEEAAWLTTLECNMRNPVFADRRVRQAIFHAIDRGFIAKTVFYGYGRAGGGPINSRNTRFISNDIAKLEFDPKTSMALLDNAGLQRKPDGKRFAVNLVAAGWFSENAKVGAYVKQALEDVGIAVNLTNPDRPTSVKRIYTDYEFDLAISNTSSASDPVPSMTQYYTTDGMAKGVAFRNASGFSSPELDALVDRIRVETNADKRKRLIADFQAFVTNEAVFLPLVEIESVTVANKAVRNHSNDANFVAGSWADVWMAR